MAVNIIEDIKTVTELKTRTRELLAQAHRTRRPIVITVNGAPDVVLIDAAEYEKQREALNLASLLSAGEADIREARTRPVDDFLTELEHEKPVPRRDHKKRRA